MTRTRSAVLCTRVHAACSPPSKDLPVRPRHLIPAVATAVALTFTPTTAHAEPVDFFALSSSWSAPQWQDFQHLAQLNAFYDAVNTSLWYQAVNDAAFDSTHDAAAWDRVAWCEEHGDWTVVGSRYSGGLGFANSTWNAWGGQQYAPRAGQATRQQQILVADSHVDSIGHRGRIEATRSDCSGYSGW